MHLLDKAEPSPDGSRRRRLISFVEDRHGHDHRYAIDASKIEQELGWRAQETFETGMAKTIHWYLENRPWWQSIIERGYDGKRRRTWRAPCGGHKHRGLIRGLVRWSLAKSELGWYVNVR